jgi:hypothetical protein
MTLTSRYNTFLSLSGRMKLLCLEAWIFQLIVGLLLKIIPFRKIPVLFSNPGSHGSDSPLITMQVKQANQCLIQSLAARWMLKWRLIDSQLSLGVTYDKNKKMIAHAWLKAGDFEIVEKDGDYTELFNF